MTHDHRRALHVGIVSRTDIIRFAGASGDFNPLHHDDDHARAMGYPSSFAMGMLTASYAARLLTDWFEIRSILSFSVRFVGPVWPGEALTVEGTMSSPVQGDTKATVQLRVLNADGERKLTASSNVLRPLAMEPISALSTDAPSASSCITRHDGGRVLRTVRFPVEAGKIAEFARATDDYNELFFDCDTARESRLTPAIAPLTFTASLLHHIDDPLSLLREIGMEPSRVVHGEQHWNYHAPVRAGDVLLAQSRLLAIDSVSRRNGNPMKRAIIETVYHNENREMMLTERQISLEV
ncbi:FAS1-like dehydratase domain-containing protein [Sphingobium sp.]|uniref:FAS1-like dehydratase domain-containing protein n=1 Tax=Sphingobium sp. TaxID=1912891 RepID=UPI003BB7BC2E